MQIPRFILADAATHGLSSTIVAPELDGDIATRKPKHSSITDGRDLAHLDNTFQRTLRLIFTILSLTESIASTMSLDRTYEESLIRGSILLIQEKFMCVFDLILHLAGTITAFRQCGLLQYCQWEDHSKTLLYQLPWSTCYPTG